MRKEIYFTTSKNQRVYLDKDKHPFTVAFLSRQKLKPHFVKYYASGFYWYNIASECQASDKVVFFANKSKPVALYAILNSQLSRRLRFFEGVRLKWYQLKTFIIKKLK